MYSAKIPFNEVEILLAYASDDVLKKSLYWRSSEERKSKRSNGESNLMSCF